MSARWAVLFASVATIGTASALAPLYYMTHNPSQEMSSKDLPPPKSLVFQDLASATRKETFSLCTYNVLHQELISPQRYPTVADTDLVFDPIRRVRMLRQDLRQLKPHTDIFCFEEMSPSTFQEFQQELGEDYDSHLVKRQANRPLHNAMFYKKSTFELVQHHDINLHAQIKNVPEDLKEFEDLEFYAIAIHFRWNNQHILVAMAHLHHDPRHDVIKYAEVSVLLQEVARLKSEIKASDDVRVILAGDFNAQPSNQVYRLAVLREPPTLESLEAETMVLPAWLQQRKKWLPLYQRLYGQTAREQQPLPTLSSVYSKSQGQGERGHPRYTNLTDGFTNTIDYILHDKRLMTLRLLQVDTNLYEKEDFLPSQYHASDHIILWAEFQCKDS